MEKIDQNSFEGHATPTKWFLNMIPLFGILSLLVYILKTNLVVLGEMPLKDVTLEAQKHK